MLEAFNPEVHDQLNSLACDADRVKELVCWSYGANKLSYYQYEELVKYVDNMKKALQVLEALDKGFNDEI